MALHRDIYWVGKQWAVTGYGVQACNQKQRGNFDIEGSVLWEDGVIEGVRAQKWLDAEDFDKALAAARKHYPEPAHRIAARNPADLPLKADAPVAPATPEDTTPPKPISQAAAPANPASEPPKPAALQFHLHAEGRLARFMPQWRIRSGR